MALCVIDIISGKKKLKSQATNRAAEEVCNVAFKHARSSLV
jgi:hypothetical protein